MMSILKEVTWALSVSLLTPLTSHAQISEDQCLGMVKTVYTGCLSKCEHETELSMNQYDQSPYGTLNNTINDLTVRTFEHAAKEGALNEHAVKAYRDSIRTTRRIRKNTAGHQCHQKCNEEQTKLQGICYR
ncbi:hypothetical protein ACFL17_05005 [Pseudomonadota bacterium]